MRCRDEGRRGSTAEGGCLYMSIAGANNLASGLLWHKLSAVIGAFSTAVSRLFGARTKN
jgi:hypothetical protein